MKTMSFLRRNVSAILLIAVAMLAFGVAAEEHLEVCSGEAVHLNFSLGRANVLNRHWTFRPAAGQQNGSQQQDVDKLADYEEDNFVPAPRFSGRVAYSGQGLLELSCATVQDTGTYVLHERSLDNFMVKQRTEKITVYVKDKPKTRRGYLEVGLLETAVYDNSTGQWHVQLTCGQFSDRGHPPVEVVWKGPDGEEMTSSHYDEDSGLFVLHAPNPVQGGNYTCRLTKQDANVCLPLDSPLTREVGVEVDKVDTRFALQEARLAHVSQQLTDTQAALRHALADQANHQEVSFNAKRTSIYDRSMNSDSRQGGFTVTTNVGQAFDGKTGIFTSPGNATFFFVVTVKVYMYNGQSSYHGHLRLITSDPSSSPSSSSDRSLGDVFDLEATDEKRTISCSSTMTTQNGGERASCQAVVTLAGGAKLWVEIDPDDQNKRFEVNLSGFLVSH